MYVAGIFLGGAYGFVITIGLKNISERVSSAHRGTAVGVYYVLTYIGFSVPFVYALIAKRHGDIPTMHMLAVAGVACVPVRAIVTRFEPK